MVSTLGGLITINLLNAKQSANINTTVSTLVSDVKEAQIKAMTGDTEGRGSETAYGVYFGTNSYTIFHGKIYSSADPTNFSVAVDTSLSLSTTFPSSQVVFTSGDGSVSGFTSGQNTITINDLTNAKTKTIYINAEGVITNIL